MQDSKIFWCLLKYNSSISRSFRLSWWWTFKYPIQTELNFWLHNSVFSSFIARPTHLLYKSNQCFTMTKGTYLNNYPSRNGWAHHKSPRPYNKHKFHVFGTNVELKQNICRSMCIYNQYVTVLAKYVNNVLSKSSKNMYLSAKNNNMEGVGVGRGKSCLPNWNTTISSSYTIK